MTIQQLNDIAAMFRLNRPLLVEGVRMDASGVLTEPAGEAGLRQWRTCVEDFVALAHRRRFGGPVFNPERFFDACGYNTLAGGGGAYGYVVRREDTE